MPRFNRQQYCQMFDALLSEELSFAPAYASENHIRDAIKRILGRVLKAGNIKLYSNLRLDEGMNVYFTITDPDGTIVDIKLMYGE